MESLLTSKGQMTIPKEARDRLGLKPGDKVKLVFQADGRLVILPKIPITALQGMLRRPGQKPASIEDMNRAVRKAAVKRFLRSAKP